MTIPHEKLSDYLRAETARGTFPGAQYAAGEDGRIVLEGALGFAAIEPETVEATIDTIYDLASLTKPLVTALLAAILAERRLLDLNAPVSVYLRELCIVSKIAWPEQTTITDLLTHTSGLTAWIPLYLESESRDDAPSVIARIAARASTEKPQVVYSDVNYILLGFILERIAGQRLDLLAGREIFDPLSLARTMFNPPPELQSQIAATERGREYERRAIEREREKGSEAEKEKGRVGEWEKANKSGGALDGTQARDANLLSHSPILPFSSSQSDLFTSSPLHPLSHSPFPPFSHSPSPLRGEVHDGNARFLDGVAGHAGLFSTAREVFRIANQFLPGSLLLKSDSLRLFTGNFTRGRGDRRSIGWMLAETPNCSAGPLLPPGAFGHTGFTGTSIWVDPVRNRVMVLLTNRIHPAVTDVDMKAARQKFNSLAIEAMDAAGQSK